MMRALQIVGLVGGAAATQEGSFLQVNLGVENKHAGLVRALEFKHSLRVCNAYPSTNMPLEVIRGESEKLTDAPMPYKSCKDFAMTLKSGDQLDFKVGEAAEGTFSVAELPENDAVLLLVARRHDDKSSSMAFDSHIFANTGGVQVAVIDAFKGKERASPRIKDFNGTKSEELRYSSVVAVNQGKYDIVLDDQEGRQRAKHSLVALNHQSYVVLRTGVEAEKGERFPEQLVVFPESDPAELPHSGSAKMVASLSALAMAIFAVMLQ